MKLGFWDALRHTAATGEPPTPQPRPAREEPMGDLHEQLLASLRVASPITVPTVPGDSTATPIEPTGPSPRAGQALLAPKRDLPRFAPYEDRDLSLGARARQARDPRRGRKGTIEEALGPQEDIPVPPGRDDRTGDGEDHGREVDGPAVVDHPHPARGPVERGAAALALTLACPICKGTGFLTHGAKTQHCGRCGGEGYVEDPHTRVARSQPKVYTGMDWGTKAQTVTADPVEQALAREAAGVQPLLLVVESPVEVVQHEVLTLEGGAAASVLGHTAAASDPALHTALTYDLPTSLDDLPAFCFICGPAGTGKTFWAKALAAGDPEGIVLAATTGIAAVNLGEGTTINSLLKFFNTQSLTEAYTGGWLESQFKRLRAAGLKRIILDETSMLDGDQLTILSRALDNVNQDRGEDDADLGLILIGDFAQLPPVKAPFAFESAEWGRYAEATYGLSTIRRQADVDFIEALQAVRRGDATRALEFFADRLEQTTHSHFPGTTILAKNDAVDKYNQLRLDKVPGAAITFGSQRWGKLRPEWGGPPKPPHEWGVPEVLHLKIGALVMILANRNVAEKGDPPSYLYVNGDLGEVVQQEHGCATVILQRTGEEVQVVPITRENVIPLEPGRRKALKEEGHPERISANGKSEVIGACSYMPLRLAYGTTVHKSQGLSLDQVQVNIRDHFFISPSMLYVALSRARTAEGLRVVGTPEGFRTRCAVDRRVQPWL